MGLSKDFQSTFRKAIGLLMASKGYNIAHKILMYNFYINCLIEQFQNIQYRHTRTVSDNPPYPSYLQDFSVHSTTHREQLHLKSINRSRIYVKIVRKYRNRNLLSIE